MQMKTFISVLTIRVPPKDNCNENHHDPDHGHGALMMAMMMKTVDIPPPTWVFVGSLPRIGASWFHKTDASDKPERWSSGCQC